MGQHTTPSVGDSAAVRRQLVDALRVDLVGPHADDPTHAELAEERLGTTPSNWYLTGFLVPAGSPPDERADDDADDELDAPAERKGLDDDAIPEGKAAARGYFPSSFGLSVLVSDAAKALHVDIAWADYAPHTDEGLPWHGDAGFVFSTHDGDGNRKQAGIRPTRWHRVPRRAALVVPLDAAPGKPYPLPGEPDVHIVLAIKAVTAEVHLPVGTRAVSVFLVNRRRVAPDVSRDAAYLFQADMTITAKAGFVARPSTHRLSSEDPDERVADLQYHDAMEYGVGHNIAAIAEVGPDKRCTVVKTAWIPLAEVEKVIPRGLSDVELRMEKLAEMPSVEALQEALAPLSAHYREWIDTTAANITMKGQRGEVAAQLVGNARRAEKRIAAGLAMLSSDAAAFNAFCLANRAIARAIRQRLCHGTDKTPDSLAEPAWRPFQLAFLLMNLPGLIDPSHPDRDTVDLLFFPTGGGKTEAYLGIAAFAMALRRLRDPSRQSAGLAVLMRYTLRLLTLDQLGRAATLICALELERQNDVERLGGWPFEIGLWVGQAATPNHMGSKGDSSVYSARHRTIAYQNDPGRKPSPIPLEECPWCGWKFTKNSFRLLPDADFPTDLRVSCDHRACEFHHRRQDRGLPILTVDEAIYRRLPAFMIATVDKFAALPWVGETAGLFGRVERWDEAGFYPTGVKAGIGSALRAPLLPPDLIIQDELHLISGPLGTMVGLYEAAIDLLATHSGRRPKVIASTATVRRAERQIRALFGRSEVAVFPPPGPDRRDSFFALTVPSSTKNARQYVGIAALGRNMKVVLLRTYLALMGAAQRAWEDHGGAKNPQNPADPYMTLLGYFNSLRELGGSRRIVEDEVATRLMDLGPRRRRLGEKGQRFANRPRISEPAELTSRVSTNAVADTKRRLALGHIDKDHVDVALATNMISVGLDITRLGLMVVLGQPKTTSEYIQATSRVGRDDGRPGLVVALLNVYRPRDRSHYERFAAWHESFYRSVEATSVTPFSPRAIDRGLVGVTVAVARLGIKGLAGPLGAGKIGSEQRAIEEIIGKIAARAESHDLELDKVDSAALRARVRERALGLVDAWTNLAKTHHGGLQYANEIGQYPPLLRQPLDQELSRLPHEARQFTANRSLRDVEPSVALWLKTPDGIDISAEEPK